MCHTLQFLEIFINFFVTLLIRIKWKITSFYFHVCECSHTNAYLASLVHYLRRLLWSFILEKSLLRASGVFNAETIKKIIQSPASAWNIDNWKKSVTVNQTQEQKK